MTTPTVLDPNNFRDLVDVLCQSKSEFDNTFTMIQSLLVSTLSLHEARDDELTSRETACQLREETLRVRDVQLNEARLKLDNEKNKVEDVNLKMKEKLTLNVGGKII